MVSSISINNPHLLDFNILELVQIVLRKQITHTWTKVALAYLIRFLISFAALFTLRDDYWSKYKYWDQFCENIANVAVCRGLGTPVALLLAIGVCFLPGVGLFEKCCSYFGSVVATYKSSIQDLISRKCD